MTNKDHRAVLQAAEETARTELGTDTSGHDWWHVHRVRNLAVSLAREEGADPFVTELAALLHDIADVKFSGSTTAGRDAAHAFCTHHQLGDDVTDQVSSIVHLLSFKGGLVPDAEMSLEGQCVRDADRLDAIGAIGIGRAFAYGGHVNRPMWDPHIEPGTHTTEKSYRSGSGTTINHFSEKLLLLKDRITTTAGKRRAAHRHAVTTKFLTDFLAEWHDSDDIDHLTS